MIRTRATSASDHDFLKQLHHAAYREVVTRQFGGWVESDQDAWFEKGLSEAAFEVIEKDGRLVGALALQQAPDHLFLMELQILPDCQQQGIGTAVLRSVLERAAALALPVQLRVLHQNRARALYERHGFVVTGATETHYLMSTRVDARR